MSDKRSARPSNRHGGGWWGGWDHGDGGWWGWWGHGGGWWGR
jgi:hypothetical protein